MIWKYDFVNLGGIAVFNKPVVDCYCYDYSHIRNIADVMETVDLIAESCNCEKATSLAADWRNNLRYSNDFNRM